MSSETSFIDMCNFDPTVLEAAKNVDNYPQVSDTCNDKYYTFNYTVITIHI